MNSRGRFESDAGIEDYGDRSVTVGTAFNNAARLQYVFLSAGEEHEDSAEEFYAVAHFTPKRARKIALAILRAADQVEAGAA